MRFAALSIVVLVCLATAEPAAAHSRTPTIALDYRVVLSSVPPGVHADVVDGDRSLQVSVAPGHTLLVRGLLGEPLLRFGPNGVWVNRSSPSASSDRIGRAGSGWALLTRGHAALWHDHRLAPPPGLRDGQTATWSVPVVVDGHAARLGGTFTRVGRPSLWPWLVTGILVAAAVAAFAHVQPRRRAEEAAAVAAVAAVAALAASAAFATGDAIAKPTEWLDVGAAAFLALLAGTALLLRRRGLRTWAATIVGVVAAAIGLGSLSVFRHGVVISSLPASIARLATAVALVGGAAAVVLAVTVSEKGARR